MLVACRGESDLDLRDVGRVAGVHVDPGDQQPVRSLTGADLATRVAFELVAPAEPELPADGQEPAADALRIRQRIPDVVDRRVVGAAQADCAAIPCGDPPLADLTLHGLDLVDDVDHSASPSVVAMVAVLSRRARFPRASSVSSESRRCSQNERKLPIHSSSSRNGSGSTA